MSDLNPFFLNSLRKMRAELIGMQKDDLSIKSLYDLLPKYRDGLVGTGVYNPVSQILSGQQYVTDPDQLDAVRRQTIKMVDAAIASIKTQDAEPVLQENLARLPEKESSEATPTAHHTALPRFSRRVWDDFRGRPPIEQITIAVAVLGALGTAIGYFYQSWLTPALPHW
jgi:hypothetical protein